MRGATPSRSSNCARTCSAACRTARVLPAPVGAVRVNSGVSRCASQVCRYRRRNPLPPPIQRTAARGRTGVGVNPHAGEHPGLIRRHKHPPAGTVGQSVHPATPHRLVHRQQRPKTRQRRQRLVDRAERLAQFRAPRRPLIPQSRADTLRQSAAPARRAIHSRDAVARPPPASRESPANPELLSAAATPPRDRGRYRGFAPASPTTPGKPAPRDAAVPR